MNNLSLKKITWILGVFPVLFFSACGQDKYDYNYKTSNSEVININNHAVNIFIKILGGKAEYKDSLPKVENDLRLAIKLDSNYKQTYINLINCIESSKSVRPFEKNPEYFNKLINVCNSWLDIHKDDMDMRLKRGIFYERKGDVASANKDYVILEKYLGALDIKVKSNMDEKQISEIINYAFLYVTVRKPKSGIELIDQLHSYFPDDPNVVFSYDLINKRTREEQIFKFQY